MRTTVYGRVKIGDVCVKRLHQVLETGGLCEHGPDVAVAHVTEENGLISPSANHWHCADILESVVYLSTCMHGVNRNINIDI